MFVHHFAIFSLAIVFFTNDTEHNCYPLFLSGSVVEVFSDDDDFRGIVFQSHTWRTVSNSYPEVFEVTYKLTVCHIYGVFNKLNMDMGRTFRGMQRDKEWS